MPLFDLLTDVSIRTSFATIVRQKDVARGQDGDMQVLQKRAAGSLQRPLNMGQRSDMPLPEVAFMPWPASPILSAADLPNGIPRPL